MALKNGGSFRRGGGTEMQFSAMLRFFPFWWRHHSRELHQFFIRPSAKHKQYLTEVCHRHAPSTLNLRPPHPLSLCFASLSSFDSRVWMGTSHSTSSRLFNTLYLTLTVPDSCRDTLGLLIVVLWVLLHFCRIARMFSTCMKKCYDIKAESVLSLECRLWTKSLFGLIINLTKPGQMNLK